MYKDPETHLGMCQTLGLQADYGVYSGGLLDVVNQGTRRSGGGEVVKWSNENIEAHRSGATNQNRAAIPSR